jgi:cytidylate kinase
MISEAPVITIDGPSGVGKGTLCRLLADALGGWHILDSGVLYRLTALAALKNNIPLDEEEALADLARHLSVSFSEDADKTIIFLDDEDVSNVIRSEQCGAGASRVAALSLVRSALLERQRKFRQWPGLVADGRDMGTVVFPDAGIKIFLTASAEERASRRYKQVKEKGIDASLATLVKEIAERDERDAARQVAPLKPARDAIIIDSTNLAIDEVRNYALTIINNSCRSMN